MRSSTYCAGLRLELPPVTVADRVSCGLMLGAGAFAAQQAFTHGRGGWGVAALVAAVALSLAMRRRWTRSRRALPCALELGADGHTCIRLGDGTVVPARVGPGTRRLGPSVFLDLHFALRGCRHRYRAWLTRADVPAEQLRQWTVVLPTGGREVGS